MLLNGIAPVMENIPSSTSSATLPVADSSGSDFGAVKQFEFDYEGTKKILRKKARKTLNNIVRHIIPEEMLEDEYIKDKMEQDIDTLSGLYYQLELNNVMQRSIVENVSRGNTMPRMYEVFTGMTDRMEAINKQIVSTEQQIRRTYLDLKIEIRERENENIAAESQQKRLDNGGTGNLIVSSSKQLIEMAKERHKQQMLAKVQETKEAEYQEE
jgi:hypothetical protein